MIFYVLIFRYEVTDWAVTPEIGLFNVGTGYDAVVTTSGRPAVVEGITGVVDNVTDDVITEFPTVPIHYNQTVNTSSPDSTTVSVTSLMTWTNVTAWGNSTQRSVLH